MSIRTFTRVTVVFAIAAAFSIAFADDGAKGAKIQFTESIYDFGTVAQGTPVKHVFKFKNVGSDTLRIEQVKTSCGCTAAWESSKIIPPDKEGQIEVTFNTASQLGKASKTVYVVSNDVEMKQRSVKVTGTVEAKKVEAEKK